MTWTLNPADYNRVQVNFSNLVIDGPILFKFSDGSAIKSASAMHYNRFSQYLAKLIAQQLSYCIAFLNYYDQYYTCQVLYKCYMLSPCISL